MNIYTTRTRCATQNPQRGTDDIDRCLARKLQEMVDDGATIVSVQQTRIEYAQPNNPSTNPTWAEFLIISTTA